LGGGILSSFPPPMGMFNLASRSPPRLVWKPLPPPTSHPSPTRIFLCPRRPRIQLNGKVINLLSFPAPLWAPKVPSPLVPSLQPGSGSRGPQPPGSPEKATIRPREKSFSFFTPSPHRTSPETIKELIFFRSSTFVVFGPPKGVFFIPPFFPCESSRIFARLVVVFLDVFFFLFWLAPHFLVSHVPPKPFICNPCPCGWFFDPAKKTVGPTVLCTKFSFFDRGGLAQLGFFLRTKTLFLFRLEMIFFSLQALNPRFYFPASFPFPDGGSGG